jgi:hypothetical protein
MQWPVHCRQRDCCSAKVVVNDLQRVLVIAANAIAESLDVIGSNSIPE